jgi:hypothetical protein
MPACRLWPCDDFEAARVVYSLDCGMLGCFATEMLTQPRIYIYYRARTVSINLSRRLLTDYSDHCMSSISHLRALRREGESSRWMSSDVSDYPLCFDSALARGPPCRQPPHFPPTRRRTVAMLTLAWCCTSGECAIM